MRQLKTWQGDFGRAYTERNAVDWRTLVPAFRQMVGGLSLQRVLEVGCNRGHNLIALAEILGEKVEAVGIEPNQHALQVARGFSPRIGVLSGHALDLPFKEGYFDLTFTCGVLIHIPLPDLSEALREMYRVTRQYLLSIEYFAEEETPLTYRGQADLLWKRDFLRHWLSQFPGLHLVRNGYWGLEDGFDRTHWWLLEKPADAKGVCQ
jgi:pseudaminic acid biosynthesis-associated methylase